MKYTKRRLIDKECLLCESKYLGENRSKYCSPGCVEDAIRHQKWGVPTKELREFRLSNPNRTCAICGTKDRIVLDHDHKNNVIRGWLCQGHNAAIGTLGDNVESLQKVVNYLKRSNL